MLKRLADTVERQVGEPYLSAELGFFNLAAAAGLYALPAAGNVCALVRPDVRDAWAHARGFQIALLALAVPGTVCALVQLVPGRPSWRSVRRRAGLLGLLVLRPAAYVVVAIGWVLVPGVAPGCGN